MAVPKLLIFSQLIGFMIGVVLSLFMLAATILNFKKFRSHCFLFSHGDWEPDDQLKVTWASKAYCVFVIFAGVIMLVVSCIQLYRLATALFRDKHCTFLSAFIEAVACSLIAVFTMYCAVMVTLGFMTWCEDMDERYPTCIDAEGENFDKADKIDTTDFYVNMNILQVTSWIAFLTWLTLTVCSMAKMCYIHYWRNLPTGARGEAEPLLNGANRA